MKLETTISDVLNNVTQFLLLIRHPSCYSYIKGHNGLPTHTSFNKLVLNCSQQKQYDTLVINITGNNYKCPHARTDGYDACNIRKIKVEVILQFKSKRRYQY